MRTCVAFYTQQHTVTIYNQVYTYVRFKWTKTLYIIGFVFHSLYAQTLLSLIVCLLLASNESIVGKSTP